jgi:hypothetical protein
MQKNIKTGLLICSAPVCAAHASSHQQVKAPQLAIGVRHDHHANVVGEDVHAVVTCSAAKQR